ncbi:MAG: hypothetical protein KTR22_07170 [Flavobacteriaceae bacterium]|nr:hypothetical protein [Flavobacteriaceae bacterium]
MSDQKKFKLCITMAGAVSAGGYTAGVLDYLLETLELWEQAKDKNRKLGKDHPDYDTSIPMHDVEIDVISGSSAGGISGTLTMLALANKNHKGFGEKNPNGDNNVFYKSWVEMADDNQSDTLEKLLNTRDLEEHDEIRSLLNTEAIEVIADKALSIDEQRSVPAYASKSLDLILTTTNLRGVNFRVNFDGNSNTSSGGTVITNHGGFFRYKLTNDQFAPGIPKKGSGNDDDLYYVLDFKEDKDMEYLKGATLSTAAFPIGLKSRKISISSEYIKRYPRYLFGTSDGITPIIPEGENYTFNSVDGGLINNEPYGIGLKMLREKNPNHFKEGKYAVLMIDPFPNKDQDVEETGSSILKIAGGMFKALRNQVMFNQDGIIDALSLEDRTKFLVEPIRKVENDQGKWVRAKSDLAAAPISGFAGFLSKKFRAHDFQLGRRNCQSFLRYYFAVPEDKIESRLCHKAEKEAMDRFQFMVPPRDPNGNKFFPIIPDMRVLSNFDEKVDLATYGKDAFIELLPYPKLSFSRFEKKYKKRIKTRIGKISKGLIGSNFLGSLANFFFIKKRGYKTVANGIKDSLGSFDLLE